jgi:hypothetical protein
VLEGGRSKRYITRDAQGRFVVEIPRSGHQESETVTYEGEPRPPAGNPKGK